MRLFMCLFLIAMIYVKVNDANNGMLFIATDSRLFSMPFASERHRLVPLPIDGLAGFTDVDYDPVEMRVYWVEGSKWVRRSFLNGSDIQLIKNSTSRPSEIAVDWIRRNLYTMDGRNGKIEISRLDGTMSKTLVSRLNSPRSFCVDIYNGYMWWLSLKTPYGWKKGYQVEHALLDGSGRKLWKVFNRDSIVPIQLAVDGARNNVYWLNNAFTITVADIDGNTKRSPYKFRYDASVHGLTALGDYIYWFSERRNPVEVINMNTDGNGTRSSRYATNMANLNAITAVNTTAFLYTDRNVCSDDHGGCSQLCISLPVTARKHTCHCINGYTLDRDNITCLGIPVATLFLATGASLQTISLDNQDVIVNNISIDGIEEALNLDYDPIDGYVYWTDTRDRTIRKARMDGSDEQILINNTKMGYSGDSGDVPCNNRLYYKYNCKDGRRASKKLDAICYGDDIVVDWIGRLMYWIDSRKQTIEVAMLDGSSRKIVVSKDLVSPHALCVDSESGYMWWMKSGGISTRQVMERAFLDGSNREEILKDFDNVDGITVDSKAGNIYWRDKVNIEVANLDGKMRRILVNCPFVLMYGNGFTLLDSHIYWLEGTKIKRVDKKTGGEATTIIEKLPQFIDFKAYYINKAYQVPDGNPCSGSNGGCSHLCFPLPGYRTCSDVIRRRRCACPSTHTLNTDGLTCNERETMLLVAVGPHLQMTSLDLMDYTSVNLPISGIQQARHVDYDPVEGKIYWTDVYDFSIQKAFLNGSNEQTVVKRGIDNHGGIAVDVLGRSIYWVDTCRKTIEVAKLDGSSPKIIISNDLSSPRDICLDTQIGYIWWINWGSESTIERALLDGTERAIIVKDNVGWPSGIVVDAHEKKLYWCDIKLDIIEMTELDGTSRKQLLHYRLENAFGLSLIGDYIYWSDTHRKTIERVNKRYGGTPTLILENLSKVRGLKATYVEQILTGRRECSSDTSSRCSQLLTDKGDRQAAGVNNTQHGKLSSADDDDEEDGLILVAGSANLQVLMLEKSDVVNSVFVPTSREMYGAIHTDHDPIEGHVYWVDKSKILRALMNGSDERVIIRSRRGSYGGLAVDWIMRHVYWTLSDYLGNRIEVAELTGASRTTIISDKLFSPNDICVDANIGYLWWIDKSRNPKIERSFLDGSHREVIVANDLVEPKGITVDGKDLMIYWMDKRRDRIESADIDGSNRRLVSNFELDGAFGFSLLGDFLYWADKQLRFSDASLYRVNKTTGGDIISIRKFDGRSKSLIATRTTLYATEKTTCGGNNGGCSHLCFPIPETGLCREVIKRKICACPNSYVLDMDGLTCQHPDNILIVGGRTGGSDRFDRDNFSNFTGIDVKKHKGSKILYDPVTEHLYWWRDDRNWILRSRLNGSDEQAIFYTNEVIVNALVGDWIGRYIYWIGNGNLEVIQLDGPFRKVLIKQLDDPRGFCVDGENGYIFWISNIPKIERSLLDGSERTIIIDTDLEKPSGIAVDSEEMKVYWCDVRRATMEMVNFDGENLTTNVHSVYGLTILGDCVYWAGLGGQIIKRVNKRYGGEWSIVRLQMRRSTGHPYDNILTAITSKKASKVWTVCSDDNGGCSHMCFSIRRTDSFGNIIMRPKCACPENYVQDPHNGSCLEPTKGMLLYASEYMYVRSIIYLNIDFNIYMEQRIAKYNTGTIDSMAYDPVDERVYWSNSKYRRRVFTIRSSFLNGSDERVLVPNRQGGADSIAIDWVGRNMYWLDTDLPGIVVARLDGSLSKVIISNELKNPSSMCIDVEKGFLVWTEEGDVPKIERAYLDGSQRKVVVDTQLNMPKSITVDSKESKIYWCDTREWKITIEEANVDGTERRTITTEEINSFTFSVLGIHIYLMTGDGVLWRINKHDGRDKHLIKDKGASNFVTASNEKPKTRKNECTDDNTNGGCAELCFDMERLQLGNKRICACQSNYKLNSDNVTCSESNRVLYLTKQRKIRRLVVDDDKLKTLGQHIMPVTTNARPRSINIDAINGYVYWIEGKTIRQSKLDGSETQIIVDGRDKSAVIKPIDLVIDPYCDLIFWTCAKKNAINFIKTDKSVNGVLVQGSRKMKPRYLALIPQAGYLYWTNNGRQSSIQRSRIDGTETLTIIKAGVSDPGPITVNIGANVICWVQTERSTMFYTIVCTDLAGQNKSVVLNNSKSSIIDITSLGPNIYWLNSKTLLAARIHQEESTITVITDDFNGTLSSVGVGIDQNYGNKSMHLCGDYWMKEDIHD